MKLKICLENMPRLLFEEEQKTVIFNVVIFNIAHMVDVKLKI